MTTKNIIPMSAEAERGVLGSVLVKANIFPKVLGFIQSDDFYDVRHRDIFTAMTELYEEETPVDLLTLAQKLKDKDSLKAIGGRTYLVGLTEDTPTASHAESYAKIVKRKSLARKIIKGGADLFQTGFDGSVEDAEEKILNTLHRLSEDKDQNERSVKEILEDVLKAQQDGRVRGLDTGISSIDRITVGLKRGHFWIIGGAYKSGKTLCSLEIARRVARKHKVLFYTLEMNDDEVVSTILRLEQQGKTKDEAVEAVAALSGNLQIFDAKFRLSQIEAHVLSQEEPPEVVFVDHIALVDTDDRETTPRLERVSRTLKMLAKRAGTCVIALSQISEENIKKKTGSYKGSGNIASDCDVGIVLTKDEEATTEEVRYVVDIRFNRHGMRKKIDMEFDTVNGLILFGADDAVGTAAAPPPKENIPVFDF